MSIHAIRGYKLLAVINRLVGIAEIVIGAPPVGPDDGTGRHCALDHGQ